MGRRNDIDISIDYSPQAVAARKQLLVNSKKKIVWASPYSYNLKLCNEQKKIVAVSNEKKPIKKRGIALEDRDTIRTMIAENKTSNEIATSTGYSLYQVRHFRDSERKSHVPKYLPFAADVSDAICQRFIAGETINSLRQDYKVTFKRIKKHLIKRGLLDE